jgi:hypothetical protein
LSPIDVEKDEFENYAHSDPTAIPDPRVFNPISWWNDAKTAFPSLHLSAFGTLAIPAMSAKCERGFSNTKKPISRERDRLAEDIIKASDCLKD